MEEKTVKKKRKLSDRLGILYLLTCVLMLVGQMAGSLLNLLPFDYSRGEIGMFFSYFIFIGIWAVALLWIGLTKKNRPILRALWTEPKGNNVRGLLIGFGLGFLLNGICILAAWLHGDIKLYFDSFRPGWLLLIFGAVFIQSSAEELLCRGFLYQRLLRTYSVPVAIIGNSALFALLHLGNEGVTVLSLINIFVVAILFSFMVFYMDSIWCAMAMHTAWNFCQNIVFGLPNSGIVSRFSILKLDAATAVDSFAYNVGFGVEGTLLADLVLIAACAALYFWGKKYGVKPIDIWEKDSHEAA